MPYPRQQVHLDGLSEAFVTLRQSLSDRDAGRVRLRVAEALNVLYMGQEALKTEIGKDAVYDLNDADEVGQTFGGLIFIRGLAVHLDAEVKQTMFNRHPIAMTQIDGRWTHASDDTPKSRITYIHSRVATPCWPLRVTLPQSTFPAYGKDLYYDAHVGTHPLLGPLKVGTKFLAAA